MSKERSNAARARPDWYRWLVPAVIALATFAAFLPSLGNTFVTWDDDRNFLDNPYYRGLDGPHLFWMWTTFHMGHYIPLSWMTLGLDYELWGMDARGYHLTSLVIQCGTAIALYFVARRLLALAFDEASDSPRIIACSAFAALFFAIHPLRVESVAWATERRDVLSGLFALSAIIAYLRYTTEPVAKRRWYWLTLLFFACGLLSKATVITLPAVLLVLNWYPLRRIGWDAGWHVANARRVALELLPMGVIAGALIPLTLVALAPPGQLSFAAKLAVSAYSLAMYLGKTLVPVRLSPLYSMPAHLEPSEPRFIASGILVVAVVLAALLLRKRWPGVTTALLLFGIVTFPLLGVVQNGPQIAADRYTYHAAPALAILFGGALLWLMAQGRRQLATGLGTALLVVLGALTWRQTLVWRNPLVFWNYVLEQDPASSIAETALGTLLLKQQAYADALPHLERATELDPTYAEGHDNLGVALSHLGRVNEAIVHYQMAIHASPRNHESHNNLGVALAGQGDLRAAIAQYDTAISIKPDYADAHTNLGNALVRLGELDAATGHYSEAIRLRPDQPGAYLNWGVALAQQGRLSEAIDQFRMALAVNPDNADARAYLDKAVELQASPRAR